MSQERIFLDTVFVHAWLSPRDRYHSRAQAIFPRVRQAMEVWVTEAVLIEVANGLSSFNRPGAVRFVQQCYHTPNIRVVSVDTPLLQRALRLYGSCLDKEWGLTDCISFVVMTDQQLTLAATADEHFVQAGFQALMLEDARPL